MTDTYKTYTETKKKFIEKHSKKADWHVETSPMDEYDRYHKEYIFEDGAVFYEVMSPVTETVEAEAHGVKVYFDAKFFRTEYWSSDDAKSRYYYEKF